MTERKKDSRMEEAVGINEHTDTALLVELGLVDLLLVLDKLDSSYSLKQKKNKSISPMMSVLFSIVTKHEDR